MIQEKISLYYRAGNSDKEYHVALEEQNGGHSVNFAFGRRGSTLQTGSKTAYPVDYETAKRVFDKLVQEKTAKGYTPGPNGTPYSGSAKEERATGILPQLLNPVDESEITRLLGDSAWWMQPKMDGRRMLLRKDGSGVTGINRTGLSVGLPQPIIDAANSIAGSFIIDGEAIGDTLHVFDCLQHGDKKLARERYSRRLQALRDMRASGAIRIVPTTTSAGEKREMLRLLKKQNAEGVVFKRHDAPYIPGRPASDGSQLKLKFYASASCIVAKVNQGRRSVALELVGDAGQGVSVGNVTIPPDSKVPQPGTMVEVRYLHAFRGGSLYQPLYLGIRDDIAAEACTTAQLKYRAASEEDEV